MSEKTGVDVLQTIDKALARVRLIGWPHVMDLEDARSAVAELMEAAQDYERALEAWEAGAPSGLGELDQRSADDPFYVRYEAARERLSRALSSCRSPAKDK